MFQNKQPIVAGKLRAYHYAECFSQAHEDSSVAFAVLKNFGWNRMSLGSFLLAVNEQLQRRK
jgi:hypothetical protein